MFFAPVVKLWERVESMNCTNKFTELLESLSNLWQSTEWQALEPMEKARLLWLSNSLLNVGHEGETQSFPVSQVVALNPAHESLVSEMRHHLVRLRTTLPIFQPPPPESPPTKQQVLKKLGWSEAIMGQFQILEESFLNAFQGADIQWARNHSYRVYLIMLLISQSIGDGRWNEMTPYYKSRQVSTLASELNESDVNMMRGGKLLKAMTCRLNDFLTSREADIDLSEHVEAPTYYSSRPIYSTPA